MDVFLFAFLRASFFLDSGAEEGFLSSVSLEIVGLLAASHPQAFCSIPV